MCRLAPLALLVLGACIAAPEPRDFLPNPPDRGPDHARLEMLVGRWAAEDLVTVEGMAEPIEVSVGVEARWDLLGKYVVARSTYVFSDPAIPMSESVTRFTWDPVASIYRYWTFRQEGPVIEGTMTYDETLSTWTMTESVRDPATGERHITGTGTMTYTSPYEKDVTWTGTPIGSPRFEMVGTSELVSSTGR